MCSSAAAQEVKASWPSRERVLVAPTHSGEVPPLEIRVAGQVPTLLRLDVPRASGAPELPTGEAPVRLIPVEESAFILLPSSDVPRGERIPLLVRTATGVLRFTLVTRHEETDVRVRVVPAPTSSEEDAAETLAQQLLATARARASLARPQQEVRYPQRNSFAQVDAVLWMGRRVFITLSVQSPRRSGRLRRLVQVRLRAKVVDNAQWEWPGRLLSGDPDNRRQHHVLTSVLPEGASRLELALDEENTAGGFRPLSASDEPEAP
nr:DUF2381 family protein [Archangium primigenium]